MSPENLINAFKFEQRPVTQKTTPAFVKKVGCEVAYRDGVDGQQRTTYLMMPCPESDPAAIQISPLDCVPYELWGNKEDLWHLKRYRVVDAVPEKEVTKVPWRVAVTA